MYDLNCSLYIMHKKIEDDVRYTEIKKYIRVEMFGTLLKTNTFLCVRKHCDCISEHVNKVTILNGAHKIKAISRR